MVGDFLIHHSSFLLGLISGFALSHISVLVDALFHAAMKIPQLQKLVAQNPGKVKSVVDAIAHELDKDIDEEAAKSAPLIPPAKP